MPENTPQEDPVPSADSGRETAAQEKAEAPRAERPESETTLLSLSDSGSYQTAAGRQDGAYRAEGKKSWTVGVSALTRALEAGKAEGFRIV